MGLGYPDFYSLWSAYETEAFKIDNVDLFRQKVKVQSKWEFDAEPM